MRLGALGLALVLLCGSAHAEYLTVSPPASSGGGGAPSGPAGGMLSGTYPNPGYAIQPLVPANNLSDLASASTSRTNLGLGTLATQSGTFSGTSSGTNTGDQTITLTGGVTGSGTGSFAATVITNANLTGPITSVGNATSIASQTGTGTKFVVDTGPTITNLSVGAGAAITSSGAGGALGSNAFTSTSYLPLAGGTMAGQLVIPSTDLVLNGSGSGSSTLNAPATGGGTATLFAGSDTILGAASTATLTNKTYDTAGTGNSFSINGVAATANTGTGAVARATSPTFVTPTLGAATATTLNGNTFTTGTYTLTGTAGKTLTFSNSITLAGTDAQTYTFCTTSCTIARTDAAQTFTGVQTFGVGSAATPSLVIGNSTTGIYSVSTTGLGFSVNGVNIADYGITSSAKFTFGALVASSVTSNGLVQASGTSQINWNGRGILSSPIGGQIQHGAADAASPVAQTISFQSVVAGTTNTSGVNATFTGSTSTGSGTAGDLIFQTGGTGAGATVQNAQVTALTIKGATQEVDIATRISVGVTGLTLTTGAIGLAKITASGSSPGAAGAKLELVCGTNAGSAKLIAAAGTSATAVTIVDNIGSGVTGC